jgi:glyoxylase-like metal-dependent hydrolase (beta-lactamase superfamily II)
MHTFFPSCGFARVSAFFRFHEDHMTSSQTGNPVLPPPSKRAHTESYPDGNPDAPYNPPGLRNTDSCLPLQRTGEVAHNYTCDGPAPGDIAFRWIHGSVCAATNSDPRIHVVAYNEDTYILRENPCVHWEAPFTYLLFGNTGALLIDTGATPEAAHYPLRATVDTIIRRWCEIRGRKTISLTVVLTSGEDIAQNQGLQQFADRPDTTLAPTQLPAIKQFHKLAFSWPNGTGAIDLGGRIVDVIPTPGTHKDGVTFYDKYNCFLLTGDLLFPGRIQIANDRDYVASLARLQQWSEAHPVKWVMGGHIEMMFIFGRAYPRFANNRPFEHVLQLESSLIQEALLHTTGIVGKSDVVFRNDFILLNRVGPDEQVYGTSPDMPAIPVPFWLSLS